MAEPSPTTNYPQQPALSHWQSQPQSQVQAQSQPQQQNGTTPSAHRRVYQACSECRLRKVRCDMGPVDDPNDPPCARCRREHKHCHFAPTRRRRNGGGGDETEDDDDESQVDEPRRTPRGSIARDRPLTRPIAQTSSSDVIEDDPETNHDTAAVLQDREIFNIPDALSAAFEATEARGRDPSRPRASSMGSLPGRDIHGNRHLSHDAVSTLPMAARAPMAATYFAPAQLASRKHSERRSAADVASQDFVEKAEGLTDAVKAWKKLRFVRAGWFTAMEGIYYMDYFYRFLSPLTPITVPNFHHPKTHAKLLLEEPILAVTILTIASRYMLPAGPGAFSRAFGIHEKLWLYLQKSLNRMMWGQEQFGGGFCGAGLKTASDVASTKGLRGLGTIESLLLLTEWHTRALHFPPGDDNDELIVPEDEPDAPDAPTDVPSPSPWDGPGAGAAASVHGRRIDSWLEPCWRSDRMCWSLLANAQALAYELGIMVPATLYTPHLIDQLPGHAAFLRRCTNIRRLLFVYVSQTSGRLALPSMLPNEHNKDLFSADSVQIAEHQIAELRGLHGDNVDIKEQTQDMVLYFWHSISTMFSQRNTALFSTRDATRGLVASGEYGAIIDQFEASHLQWKAEFDDCKVVPKLMRQILTIEYDYMCVYTDCIALQAVLQRCTNHITSPEDDVVPPQKLAELVGADRKYIENIRSASRNVLKIVVEGLLPDNVLKHAPVRTYFRIISVSIILLKTFSMGATEKDASLSLSLLDKAAHALRSCIVDDVHVGSRFAEMLSILTQRVRSCIIRVAANGKGANANDASATRNTPSARNALGLKLQTEPHMTRRRHPALNGLKRPASPSGSGQQEVNARPLKTNQPPSGTFHVQQSVESRTSQDGGYNSPYTPPPGGMTFASGGEAMYGMPPDGYYDPRLSGYSIMPPPFDPNNAFAAADLASFSTNGVSNNEPGSVSDWCTLPLDGIMNSGPVDVTQTGFGPDIGGQDMLEVLLGDNNSRVPSGGPPSANMAGPASTSAPQQGYVPAQSFQSPRSQLNERPQSQSGQ